jgi:hypothetical protein
LSSYGAASPANPPRRAGDLVPELVQETLLVDLVAAPAVLRFGLPQLALALALCCGKAVPIRLLPRGGVCLLSAVV